MSETENNTEFENTGGDKKLKKIDEDSSKESFDEIIPEEILEAIPEEDRGRISSIIKQTMISGVMRRNNPISDKITTEHITSLIEKSDTHDLRDREERKSEKNYTIIYILIALAFIAFLIVYLKDNQDLLIKIVIGIISFVGGFGFGKSRG